MELLLFMELNKKEELNFFLKSIKLHPFVIILNIRKVLTILYFL